MSIKMFIKRTGKANAYQMLLSFKMSIIYKKNLTSCRITVPVVKQLLPDITQFFAGRFPMSGPNIQACNKKQN